MSVARPDISDSLGPTSATAPTLTMSAIPAPPGLDDRLRRILSLDLRSLALFRIAIGTCLLFNLVHLLPEIDDFFTDRGILPRDALTSELGDPWGISVHLISGQWAVQLVLFLIAIVFAMGMIAGYRTRLCTAASWFLLSSMHVRNPVIGHSGDALLRVFLFWSMFAPLNGRYSLDLALNPWQPKPPVTHMSWGSQALMLQLCFVYWFTAASKWHPIWLGEGSAIYYALNLDQFVTPLGKSLLGYPNLLRLMTRGTVALEFLGPFLMFSPVWTGPLRLLGVLTFIGFHAALGLTMYLGTFAWVCAAGWLMFLPALVWDRLEGWTAARSLGTRIYFDGECGFCRKAVLALKEFLLLTRAEVSEAQSEPSMHALMRARNSWIVRDPEGRIHSGYDALVTLCRHSVLMSWLTPVLGLAPARWVGERMYRWVATHRTPAARVLEAVTPPPPRERLGYLSHAVVLFCLPLVFAWNLANHESMGIHIPTVFQRLVSLAGLRQRWVMFAPYPRMDDGWYVIEGVLVDGSKVDLWRGQGEPTEAKPANVAATYRDTPWRKYLTNIWLRDYSHHRLYFGRYLCRGWNEKHIGAQRLNLIYINYMLEMTPPPGKPLPKPEKVEIWRTYCLDKPPDW